MGVLKRFHRGSPRVGEGSLQGCQLKLKGFVQDSKK